jgi:hypothetical protein
VWFDHVERYEDGYILFPRDVNKVFKYSKATSHRRVHAHVDLVDPELLTAVVERLAANAALRAANAAAAAADKAANDAIAEGIAMGDVSVEVESDVVNDEWDAIQDHFRRFAVTGLQERSGAYELRHGVDFGNDVDGDEWDDEEDDGGDMDNECQWNDEDDEDDDGEVMGDVDSEVTFEMK